MTITTKLGFWILGIVNAVIARVVYDWVTWRYRKRTNGGMR